MKYHQADLNLYKKFKYNPMLLIGGVGNNEDKMYYGFKYDHLQDIHDSSVINTDHAQFVYKSMRKDLKNQMRITQTIHDLKIIIDSIKGMGNASNAEILGMKKERLITFYYELIGFIFRLTHILMYDKFIYDKKKLDEEGSGMIFEDAFKYALEFGNDIRVKYEKIFDKEFTTNSAVQEYLKSLKDAVKLKK